MSRDIDSIPEREAELGLALAGLIEVVEQTMFWIDKTTPEGQLRHHQLRGAIVMAQKTLIRSPSRAPPTWTPSGSWWVRW